MKKDIKVTIFSILTYIGILSFTILYWGDSEIFKGIIFTIILYYTFKSEIYDPYGKDKDCMSVPLIISITIIIIVLFLTNFFKGKGYFPTEGKIYMYITMTLTFIFSLIARFFYVKTNEYKDENQKWLLESDKNEKLRKERSAEFKQQQDMIIQRYNKGNSNQQLNQEEETIESRIK